MRTTNAKTKQHGSEDSPRATDSGLVSLLTAARTEPTNRGYLLALRERLLATELTPVKLWHLPDWLRRGWLAYRRHGYPVIEGCDNNGYEGYRCCRGYYSTTKSNVLTDISRWLGQVDDKFSFANIDHWGSTTICGLPCFANEPYMTPESACIQARMLSRAVGCVGIGLPKGIWHTGTVRVLFIPTLDYEKARAIGDDLSVALKLHRKQWLSEKPTCFVCGEIVPQSLLNYWLELRILVHAGVCDEVVRSCRCDRSRSKRGKLKPIGEALADVWAKMKELGMWGSL